MYRVVILLVAVALAAACADSTGPDPRTDVGISPNDGSFEITLRYVGSPSARQQVAVSRAVKQWQRVITGDLTNVEISAQAGACFRNQPAIAEEVDDILIFVDFTYVDGPGGILGEAGPCFIRSESGLPVVGFLRIDNADLQEMEAVGTLDDAVLHEFGHVLGIGTLWRARKLLTGAGTSDPRYTGAAAVSAYRKLGGSRSIPVENTGESSTREGHWRESVFGNELMTGWVGTGANPMSAVTIASLEDLGYNTDVDAADVYALADPGSVMAQRSADHTDLRGRERVHLPKFRVDRREDRRKDARGHWK